MLIGVGEFIVSALNPDMEKRRKQLFSYDRDMDNSEYVESANLKSTLLDCSDITVCEKNVLNEIIEISKLPDNWNKLGTDKISSEIIDNTLTVVEKIWPSLLYYLKPENIYPSQYGTIILDWEFDNENLLSLEIGKKSLGYFVEVGGKNHKQVDRLEISDENMGAIISSINHDISLFLS